MPFGTNPTLLDGEAIDAPATLAGGERIAVAGLTCVVVTGDAPTQPAKRFVLILSQGERIPLYLSDRRCSLVATLLQPPRGHAPGDYISDDVLIPRIWRHSGDRHALNVLVARTRKDLERAGLDGFAHIERAKPGGATRFALADGATAEVV